MIYHAWMYRNISGGIATHLATIDDGFYTV